MNLRDLARHPGYGELKMLWLQEITTIEEKRDSAASRGQESAWRYWAGVEKGFKQAVTCLDAEIERQREGESMDEIPSDKIKKLLEEAGGKTK